MNKNITEFTAINTNKANFDEIYTMDDPREYFRVLGALDYVIPELARPILTSLSQSLRELHGRRLRILDVGSSYGINAALLRFPLRIDQLIQRYNSPEMQALSAKEVIALDRHFYAAWPETVDAGVVGLDTSGPAMRYAEAVDLVEAGIAANLEADMPDTTQAKRLSGLDLIVSTGCVGYVTYQTFARLLELQADPGKVWLANFVLRMFPYDDIAGPLQERHGLVTEKLDGVTFVQRRFQSLQEFETTLASLETQNIDPSGKEAEGLFHAELYVSRPAKDVEAMPLNRLLSVTSGANLSFGERYRRVGEETTKLVS